MWRDPSCLCKGSVSRDSRHTTRKWCNQCNIRWFVCVVWCIIVQHMLYCLGHGITPHGNLLITLERSSYVATWIQVALYQTACLKPRQRTDTWVPECTWCRSTEPQPWAVEKLFILGTSSKRFKTPQDCITTRCILDTPFAADGSQEPVDLRPQVSICVHAIHVAIWSRHRHT